MKIIIAALFSICHLMVQSQNVDARQFANIEKYDKDNSVLNKDSDLVVFIGNSITEGWVNVMPNFFKKNNYIGRGIGGQTSAQLLLRFRNDVLALKPKLVVINIGTNDIAENTGPYNEDFTVNNIASMIELAEFSGIKVVLASVLPAASFTWRPQILKPAEKILKLNETLKKMAAHYQIPYLDYHSKLKNAESGLDFEMANDGVHPTLSCYEIMADLATTLIQQTLGKK